MGKFAITTFVPESNKANEWIEDIAELAAATESNPDAAAEVAIPWAKRNTELLAIREAAKAVNKTVRVRKQNEDGLKAIGTKANGKTVFEGDIVYTISLTDKYKEGRGRKAASNGDETPAPKAKN